MDDHTEASVHLTLLAIAALLCAFSLGALVRVGANEFENRSRPVSETPER